LDDSKEVFKELAGVTVAIDMFDEDFVAVYIEDYRGDWWNKTFQGKDSVTKAVNYLICEDGSTSSSSYTKAVKNNIPIVTIKNLEEIINVNN
jgi:hypothetical protein